MLIKIIAGFLLISIFMLSGNLAISTQSAISDEQALDRCSIGDGPAEIIAGGLGDGNIALQARVEPSARKMAFMTAIYLLPKLKITGLGVLTRRPEPFDKARFRFPEDYLIDLNCRLIIADTGNNIIRAVKPSP